SDGNFYGTTEFGGTIGGGTVFRVTPAGVLTSLISFDYNLGHYPNGNLLQGSDGLLYGTTSAGSDHNSDDGTIFRISTNGFLSFLVSFNYNLGITPGGDMVWGADGNLYGTAGGGGNHDVGTVFRATTNGILTALANFTYDNGRAPSGGLLEVGSGALYGV